jgi:hypothetical protein
MKQPIESSQVDLKRLLKLTAVLCWWSKSTPKKNGKEAHLAAGPCGQKKIQFSTVHKQSSIATWMMVN